MNDQELRQAAKVCIDKTAIGPGSRDKIIGIVFDTLKEVTGNHEAELEAAEKEIEILKERNEEEVKILENHEDEVCIMEAKISNLESEVSSLVTVNQKLVSLQEDDRQDRRMRIWADTFSTMARPNQYNIDVVTKWANDAVDEFDKKFPPQNVDTDTKA